MLVLTCFVSVSLAAFVESPKPTKEPQNFDQFTTLERPEIPRNYAFTDLFALASGKTPRRNDPLTSLSDAVKADGTLRANTAR